MTAINPPLKIAIIGGTVSALNLLKETLAREVKVCCMVVQIPDPHEMQETYLETIRTLEKAQIPYQKTQTFSDEQMKFLLKHQTQICFLINCRFLIPERFLPMIPKGFLVTHGSCLPLQRGFAPLNWSIILGKTDFGITLFRAVSTTDSGNILLSKSHPMPPRANSSMLFEFTASEQIKLFLEYLDRGATLEPGIEQNETLATYCCSRTPSDAEIDFKQAAISIDALVRASWPPYPRAFTFYNSEKILISETDVPANSLKYEGFIPGRITSYKKGGPVEVLCGDGNILRILTVEADNKRIPAGNIIRSVKARLGFNPTQEVALLNERIRALETRVEALAGSKL